MPSRALCSRHRVEWLEVAAHRHPTAAYPLHHGSHQQPHASTSLQSRLAQTPLRNTHLSEASATTMTAWVDW